MKALFSWFHSEILFHHRHYLNSNAILIVFCKPPCSILLYIFNVTSTSIFNHSSQRMARQNVYAIYSRHKNFEERAGYGPCLPEVGPDPVHILHLILCLLQGGGGSKQGGWGKGVGRLSVATTAALKDHKD